MSPTTATFSARRGRHPLSDRRLRMNWYLVMQNDSVDFRTIGSALVKLLVEIESKGAPPFQLMTLQRAGSRPCSELYALGVMSLIGLPAAGKEGTIQLRPPAIGGAIGPELVTEAVQAELNKEDNQRKLATAGANERSDLFVWLVDNEASMALTTPLISGGTSGMPVDGPVLPDVVSGVWAARGIYDRGWHARAVWRSNGSTWEVHPPPRALV